jgi:hypothetical protein
MEINIALSYRTDVPGGYIWPAAVGRETFIIFG